MIKRTCLLILIITVFSLSFLIRIKKPNSNLASPFSGVGKLAANLWFPQVIDATVGEKSPTVTAESAYFVEMNSGLVLYEKNHQEKLPIASLVKIMTSIVALENLNIKDTLQVSRQAAEMEPDKMLLIAGEKLTLEELLQGIFLVSANDAAEVLAEGIFGDRAKFIGQMNYKAKQLGMYNTYFINPSGLEEDGVKQYSTAYDVALMARSIIKNYPFLVDITTTPHIYIPTTNTHQDYDLYNGINLVTTYPGVVGFKTGYTSEAGLTLVTLARVEKKEVLGVLLGSTNRREDAKILLDYSFNKLGIKN